MTDINMEMRLLSDLHLEFGKFKPNSLENVNPEQVLILAGDIGERGKARSLVETFCKMFKAVIYVPGNHEFYGGEYNEVIHYWKTRESEIENLHFLNNDTVIIDGVRFIGGTMWTDMDNDNWFCKFSARSMMADYSQIRLDMAFSPTKKKYKNATKGRLLTIGDTMAMHTQCIEYLAIMLQTPFQGETVIVTHHTPSMSLTSPIYANNALNGAFHANVEHLMERYRIRCWLHGHTHCPHHKKIFDTDIYCNPRGYVGYEITGFNKDLIIPISGKY